LQSDGVILAAYIYISYYANTREADVYVRISMYEEANLTKIEQPEDLSTLVRSRRNELGETQEELGLQAGYSYRLVCEFERGRSTVAFDKVLNLCNLLGIDLYAKARD
jgi:ribosome-binding protein aMBF1 (putative translation factor)